MTYQRNETPEPLATSDAEVARLQELERIRLELLRAIEEWMCIARRMTAK